MEFDSFNALLTKLKMCANENYQKLEDNNFLCELQVNKITKIGKGLSKKKAKLEAIRLLMPQLKKIEIKKCKYHSTTFSNLEKHPLRLVEYLTNSRMDPSPTYKITNLQNGTFKCEMKLLINSECYIGIGKTKIEAKEDAAKKFIDDFQILYKTNDC